MNRELNSTDADNPENGSASQHVAELGAAFQSAFATLQRLIVGQGAETPPPTMTIEQVAAALQIGERTARRLHSRGLLPKPQKFGGALRWNRAEFLDWLCSGAPERTRWDWEEYRRESN